MKQGVQLITATTGAEVEAAAKKAVLVNEAEEVLNDSGMDRSKRVLNDDRSSNHGQLCVTVVGGNGSNNNSSSSSSNSNTVSERIM